MHVLVSLVSLETRVQDLSWDVMSKGRPFGQI